MDKLIIKKIDMNESVLAHNWLKVPFDKLLNLKTKNQQQCMVQLEESKEGLTLILEL